MPEYDNQTIMRQEIEHSFDSDNIDWLSIPLERQKTYVSDTNTFEPTSHSLSSPHLPIEKPKIKVPTGFIQYSQVKEVIRLLMMMIKKWI